MPTCLSILALAALILATAARPAAALQTASFADFDRRARAGESLSVVFFGASLTWGAMASDPNQTSYRADVSHKLEAAYPKAHFHFWDAAIGGTTSQLGVFRLDRDVLRRKPDLVFLDFTLNDGMYGDDEDMLASYESLVRRIITESHAPVVQMFLPSRSMVAQGDTKGMRRRDAHLAIARAYHCGIGDAVVLMQARVKSGPVKVDDLWLPADSTHPNDAGYALYAEAAWEGLQEAIKEKRVCAAPLKMLHADTYLHNQRIRLADLPSLPAGWHVTEPYHVSAYYDMLMSRWPDRVIIATSKEPPAPLKISFRGSFVSLFGESSLTSGKYRVSIDGDLAQEYDAGDFSRRLGNNAYLVQIVATHLDPQREHTLEITPIFAPTGEQELRLESICIAGGVLEKGHE